MSNNRNSRRRKQPSAAERARRESQTNGRGPDVADVRYAGLTIRVYREAFQDLETMESLASLDDDHISEREKILHMTRASRIIAGDRWDDLMQAIREENNGYAPMSAVFGFINKASRMLGPGPSAS